MSTLTIYRGHAFLVGCSGGPKEKRVGYLGYSSKHKWFCVTEVSPQGTVNYNYFREFPEAVAYYERLYPGVGAKRDKFISANEDWTKFTDTVLGWGWLRDTVLEWGDAWAKSHDELTTEFERRAGNNPELIDPSPGPILIGGYIHATTDGMCRLVIRNKTGKYVMGFWKDGETLDLERSVSSDLASIRLEYSSKAAGTDLPINKLAINFNRRQLIPLGEEAFKIIKRKCPPAYKWLEENGVNMPLGKQSVNITLYRGHCGTADSGVRAAYFVAEREGKFYYVRHSRELPSKEVEHPSLESAIKQYESRCRDFKAGPGELYIDRYDNGGKKCQLGEFQMELRGMGHSWMSRHVPSFWRMGEEKAPGKQVTLLMGHTYKPKSSSGKQVVFIYKEPETGDYVTMKASEHDGDFYEIHRSVSRVTALDNYRDTYYQKSEKLGEFVAGGCHLKSPERISPSEFIEEIRIKGAWAEGFEFDPICRSPSKKKPKVKPVVELFRGHLNTKAREDGIGWAFVCKEPEGAGGKYKCVGSLKTTEHDTLEGALAQYAESSAFAGPNQFIGADGKSHMTISEYWAGLEFAGCEYAKNHAARVELEPLLRPIICKPDPPKPEPIKLEEQGWELDGAAIQVESRYNGAFLLWSRGKPGNKEYRVELLGIGPTYVTATYTTKAQAIEYAHNVCRNVRAGLERKGDVRGLDGVNDFGLGISKLGDQRGSFTLNRGEYTEHDLLMQLRIKYLGHGHAQRVREILEYGGNARAGRVLSEAMRGGRGPEYAQALAGKMAPAEFSLAGLQSQVELLKAPAEFSLAGLQSQVELLKASQSKWETALEELRNKPGPGVLEAEPVRYIREPDSRLVYNGKEWEPKPSMIEEFKIIQLDSEGEQDMSNTKESIIESALPTEAERSILEKYKDEIKDMELQKVIANLEAIKQEQDKNLALARAESRKLKTSKKKRATMMQTMSLSAVFTLLTYLILARVFGRPVPNLELTQPKRRLRKGRRRERQEEQASSGPIAALAPPAGDPVPEARVRTRQRVAR